MLLIIGTILGTLCGGFAMALAAASSMRAIGEGE